MIPAAHTSTTIALALEAIHDNIVVVTQGLGQDGRDPQVSYAMLSNRTSDEIQVGDIEDHESLVVKMNSGRRKRDEEYVVVVNFWVTRHQVKDAIDEATRQLTAVENWLAENPNLGLDHLPTLRCEEWRATLNMTQHVSANGYQVHVTLRPFVKARLI